MEGAAQIPPRLAGAVRHQLGPLMRTAIEQDRHAVGCIADQDQVLPADERGHIVPDLGHLTVVADIDPGPAKISVISRSKIAGSV